MRYSRCVHSLEPELRALDDEGALDRRTIARAVARERREHVSVATLLRAMLYTGVLLVAGGLGVLLARHLERLGPFGIVAALAAVAVACAIPALRSTRAGRRVSDIADYLLLLAVLVAVADLAYAEAQFAMLGPAWPWHFVIVSAGAAMVAYACGSSRVLAVALAALAAWFGLDGSASGSVLLDGLGAAGTNRTATPLAAVADFGGRALACSAAMLLWKQADRRLGRTEEFAPLFDHFIANLAFWAALYWCPPERFPWAGLPLLALFALLSVRRGLATRREAFVVYGIGYAALGLCFAMLPRIDDPQFASAVALLVVGTAAMLLWQLHRRIRGAGT